jgi:hypothetical protein
LSKNTSAPPRRKIDAPMVMMISAAVLASRAGSIARRCSASPERRQRQRHAGSCQEHRRHAAEHDELALGEVDHAGGVVDQGEADRDQGVDRADGQPREGELKEFSHRRERLVRASSVERVAKGRTRTSAPDLSLSMIFSENRCPLFEIMLYEPDSGTSVQSPFLISSMRKAVRSRPRWSVGDMLTMPPVPT